MPTKQHPPPLLGSYMVTLVFLVSCDFLFLFLSPLGEPANPGLHLDDLDGHQHGVPLQHQQGFPLPQGRPAATTY